MLDLRYVMENLEQVRAQLARRGAHAESSLSQIAERGRERSEVIQALEALRKEKNAANEALAKLPKDSPEFSARRDALRAIAEQSKGLEHKQRELEALLEQDLLAVPNLPAEATPDGKGEGDNVLVRSWGQPPKLEAAPKEHWELGQKLGILDFERGA
jgi:seryl-tRNA synthetase